MRDPRRRNRNIGTSKSGRGQDNKNVVPDRWSDLTIYWQKLDSPITVQKQVQGSVVTFIIEPTLEGCFHSCTIEDVCGVLELVPIQHLQGIELIILRQPTRRQQILAPVWGRLGYWNEIVGLSGPGIYLEAQRFPRTESWPLSLTPQDKTELERLEKDGHNVRRNKRSYEISSTFESIRSTQLFRTLPHEIGHYVDYVQTSARFDMEEEFEEFWNLCDAKPHHDKEAFAHRYADNFCSTWVGAGQLPFPPIVNREAMLDYKLQPSWFGFNHAA